MLPSKCNVSIFLYLLFYDCSAADSAEYFVDIAKAYYMHGRATEVPDLACFFSEKIVQGIKNASENADACWMHMPNLTMITSV